VPREAPCGQVAFRIMQLQEQQRSDPTENVSGVLEGILFGSLDIEFYQMRLRQASFQDCLIQADALDASAALLSVLRLPDELHVRPPT
jgi:hypothetical protein